VIVIFCSLPVQVLGVHVQDAVGMMSNVTSICACRAGPGNVRKMELANRLVIARQRPFALQHVDFNTRLIVRGVEKISDFRVGMVVLRSMSLVNTPPSVSMRGKGRYIAAARLHFALEHARLDGPPRPPLRPDSRLVRWLVDSECAVSTP